MIRSSERYYVYHHDSQGYYEKKLNTFHFHKWSNSHKVSPVKAAVMHIME